MFLRRRRDLDYPARPSHGWPLGQRPRIRPNSDQCQCTSSQASETFLPCSRSRARQGIRDLLAPTAFSAILRRHSSSTCGSYQHSESALPVCPEACPSAFPFDRNICRACHRGSAPLSLFDHQRKVGASETFPNKIQSSRASYSLPLAKIPCRDSKLGSVIVLLLVSSILLQYDFLRTFVL